MSSLKYKYRFYVDDVEIFPIWGEDAEIVSESDGDFVFKRLKLQGKFTVTHGKRSDYNLVWAQDLDHEFTFRAEYIVNGVVLDSVEGKFFKTDCYYDEDNKIAEIEIKATDKYEKLMKAFDKEFDLVKTLKPPISSITYRKEALIQIAFPYHSELFTLVGGSYYVTELGTQYSSLELEDFGFATDDDAKIYIAGSGDMSPDVSGIYTDEGVDGFGNHTYLRTDGLYRIRSVAGIQWYIRDIIENDDKYDTPILPYQSDLHGLRNPFIQDIVFTNIDDNVTQCAAFPFLPHQRVLTDQTTVGGFATIAMPDPEATPDIGGLDFEYTHRIDMTNYGQLFMQMTPSDAHTVAETEYGKFADDAIHFSGEYFNPDITPFPFTRAYPVLNPSWREYSVTAYVTGGYGGEILAAATEVSVRDAYKLEDVLKKILYEIDPLISFEPNTTYSKFLFDNLNPVSGDNNEITHFIVPRSNILTENYDEPDTSEIITFKNLDDLLKAARLFWWIDNAYNFKIEHISYFKNGMNYTTPIIGYDFTTKIEPMTGKPWSHGTNKFRYKKEGMPEELRCSWSDKTSRYFDGSPIKINSLFVEKGSYYDLSVSKFVSDIAYALSNPQDSVNDTGFFILACEDDGGTWKVLFEAFDIAFFNDVYLQNGWWSFYYLHDKFWRHNLPAQDVNLNGIDITATSTMRGRESTIVVPTQVRPDPMRLVRNDAGNAEIESVRTKLNSRRSEFKILNDLDFDNPCPTC